MDPGEGVDFKTLRSKFQNPAALNIRTKPVIPEKPKSLTSPTTKISNPLIATINSAVENRTPFAPRVVFKDEKKSPVKRLFSQSDTVEIKKDIHPELLDKKQKKEGDLIKQALKDKKLPLVLPVSPVTPVIQETPKPDPVPASPALASPVKISTPKEKSVFNFKKPLKAEEQKTNTSESDLAATPVFQSEPAAPKSVIPQVQAEAALASISPAPDPVISPRVGRVSEVPIPTVREPDIVSQISPHVENSKPEILVTNRNPQPDAYLPVEVDHSPEIPDILDINIPPPLIPEDIPDADIPDVDISALNIPPPVTPDSSVSSVASEVSSSPDMSRSASPVPAASASVTPEPSGTSVPATVILNSDAAPVFCTPPRMPSPALDVNPWQENGKAEFHEVVGQTENTPEVPSSSSKNISALSALARAEEMSPVRHNHCDQRVLNLLEKAKRKHTVNHQMPTPVTPEIMTSVETATPAVVPPESSVPEKSQAEEAQAEPVLSVEDSLGPETPVESLLDFPPVDYEFRAVRSKPPTSKTALTNGLDQRDASPVPKVRPEQSPTKVKTAPPPPPRRTTLPPGSSLSVTPEKPPRAISVDSQTVLPAHPVEANEIIIPAPVDFVSQNSTFDDSEVDGSSEAVAVDPPQASVSEYGNPTLSVHDLAFLEQLSPAHHNSEEFVPNVETTVKDVKLEKAAGPPASAPDSPVIPSPSGMSEINYNSSDNVHEDPAVNKKSKTLKKQRKGVLMNPYVDSPAANEEISRKTLFAKKTASLDDKELKKKEKRKEKEKEKKEQKEKEKEKREQKEKEKEHKEKEKEKKEHKDKEKKEHKDKEKEKEHKEKEKEKDHKKEKKELKDKEKEKEHKEKEKKELKDKEKEKKEQKEKEREKKEQREKREQKEKEKKENEMKKKFKITGEEEALYQTKVRETFKGHKDDLAVKAGETVSIIRTTDCPKGKWLARDSNNKYGYILVKSVDLDIQEMMELGKRAKTSSTPNSNGFIETEVTSTGSRSSHPYALHHESYDSEEWCDDDDDTVFTPTDSTDLHLNQRLSSLDVVTQEPNPTLQGQIDANDKTRQEALQKLASFFAQPKTPDHATLKRNTIIEEAEPEESVSEDKQDVDLQILPPPDLYADIVFEES
ncbi:hypothetical protein AOLI_G00030880 [Acnodon oligacanthus]